MRAGDQDDSGELPGLGSRVRGPPRRRARVSITDARHARASLLFGGTTPCDGSGADLRRCPRAAARPHVQNQAVILKLVAVPPRDGVLQALDLLIHELDHLATLHIDHVVVVKTTIEFKYGLPALEVVLLDDPGRLKLGQHPVDGRQTDVLMLVDQLPVDVLSRQVPRMTTLQDGENAHARMRHFQPDATQFLHWFHGGVSEQGRPQCIIGSFERWRMQMIKRTWTLAAAVALASASALPGCGIIYKPDIQQGNLLEKSNVQELKPGLSKAQVLSLLGQPSVISPFDGSRWDYVSTFQHRGGKTEERKLTLLFKNGVLVRTEGDYFAETPKQMLKASYNFEGNYQPGSTQDASKPGSEPPGDGGRN